MKRKSDSQHGSNAAKAKTSFKRNFEHVDGNWPSHVFLDGPYHKLSSISQACLRDASSSSSSSTIEPIDKPHLSISRPFVLRHHHISHFVKRLGELIEHFQCLTVHVESAYYWLRNDNGTREFLALPVKDTRGKLKSLVRLVNEALLSFQQPKYYKDPLFHISVGSRLPSAGPVVGSSFHPVLHLVHPGNSGNSHGSEDAPDSCSEEEEDVPVWLRSDETGVGGEEGGVTAVVSGERVTASGSAASAGAGAGAGSILGGLLAGYDSESNSDCSVGESNGAGDKGGSREAAAGCGVGGTGLSTVQTDQATGPAVSTVLMFTAIVCKIGNRTFRMDLLPLSGVLSGASRSTTRGFVEVGEKL